MDEKPMRAVMSVAATTSAPAAGWYPDPTEPNAQLRWWDGAAWSPYTTDVPEPEPDPHPFTDVVVDLAETDEDVPEESRMDDVSLDVSETESDPIEFSWDDLEVTVAEKEAYSFRVRALAPDPRPEPQPQRVVVEVPSVPVYESPLATIASPVSVRVEVPVRVDVPVPAPQPQPEAAPEPEAEAEAAAPAAVTPSRRRIAVAGTGAVVVVAAAAAGITNLISGGDEAKPGKAKAAPVALSTDAKRCLKEWNTTASGSAAQMRVTLGQFEGAFARVGAVKPLPGTVMAADSCALSVYDPRTDTHAIFVSGVKDTIGYMDVTSYPRASTYGWPKTEGAANAAIRSDGSIRGL